MLNQILIAVALVLVIEGILPFLSPTTWKEMLQQFMRLPDRSLRIAGLMSMVTGVVLLYLIT